MVIQKMVHPRPSAFSFVIGLPFFTRYARPSSSLYLRFFPPIVRLLFPDKRRTHDHTEPDLALGHTGAGILRILASVPGIRAFAFVFCLALKFFLIPFR